MGRHTVKWAKLAVTANAEFFAVLSVYMLFTLIASRVWNISIHFELYDKAFALFTAAFAVLVISYLIVKMFFYERPERPFRHLWYSKLKVDWAIQDRLCIGLPAALVMPIFFSLFTSLKASISYIVPFYADPFLASADRILMGNNDAWRILQPLVGLPVITFIVNFFYNFWFFAAIVPLILMTFLTGDLRLRRRYLVASILVWAILGNLLAIIFSSVGPCFYKVFYGLPRYADLMAYLHLANRDFPIWALTAQDYLLAARNGSHIGAGISAFPSMHVAVAMLNVMLCRNFSRTWQITSILFLSFILVGSVHLGWHYAIDGYFSIIAVPIIWWLAGKISLTPLVERIFLSDAAPQLGSDLSEPVASMR
jgi:hypothetical protein